MLRKLPSPRNPQRPAASASAADVEAPCENFRTRREKSLSPVVLIVERDRLLRWALYEVLSAAGFRVLTAPGPSCVEWIVQQVEQNVALVLLDDDSWPLTALTRATLVERWPAVVIAVTTQSDDPAVEARARKHGAVEVLIKPFELPELVHLVERLIGLGAHAANESRAISDPSLATALR